MKASHRVMLVGIDDRSLKYLGKWPWPRQYHADLIRIFGRNPAYKPSVIGYDVLFTEADAKNSMGDSRLVRETKESGNIVHAYYFRVGRDKTDKIKPFGNLQEVSEAGFINVFPDVDGNTRWIPLVFKDKDEFLYSMTLVMACAYLDADLKDTEIELGKHIIIKIPDGRGIKIPIDSNGRMFLNFMGNINSFRNSSFFYVPQSKYLEEQGRVTPIDLSDFKDKVVIVGVSATGVVDTTATPFSTGSPMMLLHATCMDNILENDFVHVLRPRFNLSVFLIVACIAGIINILSPPLKSGLINFSLGFLFLIVSLFIFLNFGIIVDIVGPITGILFVFAGTIHYKFAMEEREKKFIKEK